MQLANFDRDDQLIDRIPRSFAWVVFALTFGLLISDYMSRQVLNAVFPLLKADWSLTDAQLGSLSGVVALMVGLLTFPLSLLADRFGRIRSLVTMAVLWSIATLACGIAENYQQMFAARVMVGVGEAAYGSVGIAVVLSVFPKSLRATLTSAFMAGGVFGSVLGMAFGGMIANVYGWRVAFIGMAVFGLLLAAIYPFVVKSSLVPSGRKQVTRQIAYLEALRTLIATRSVICAYLGSGLQLFVTGAFMAWLPTYLHRYYNMDTGDAGGVAGGLVLCGGVGMVLCGVISDRLCKNNPSNKTRLAVTFCCLTGVCLFAAFSLPAGPMQLILIALGMFIAPGTSGPAGAMVANLTHASVHGTAFATLTLANNLLGLAPAPFVVGFLADDFGLNIAMMSLPIACIASGLCFGYAIRHYQLDLDGLRRSEITPS